MSDLKYELRYTPDSDDFIDGFNDSLITESDSCLTDRSWSSSSMTLTELDDLGDNYLKLSSVSPSAVAVNYTFSTIPGRTYTIRVNVKAKSGSWTSRVRNCSGTSEEVIDTNVGDNSVEFTANSSFSKIFFQVAGGGGELDIDEIESSSEESTQVKEIVQMQPEGTLKVDQQRESGQVFYRKKLNGKLRVYKKDEPQAYSDLKSIADNIGCKEAELRIFCGGVEEFRGRIRRKNVGVNLTKCYVTLSPDTLDEYTCILDNWDRRSNIYFEDNIIAKADSGLVYEEISATAIATTTYNPSTLYTAITTAMVNAPNSSETPPSGEKYYQEGITGTELDKPVEWCLIDNSINIETGTPDTLTIISKWGRELYSVPTGGTPVGDGWTLHAGLSGGGTDIYWRCPRTGCVISDLNYGKSIEDVCNKLVSDMPCGISEVESILLNMGSPSYSEPTTKEYGFKDDYQYVTLHQKSDVISPNASQPAGQVSWYLTFKELVEMLSIHNMKWDIFKGNIRFEHLSFYELSTGEVITTDQEITYESEDLEIPSIETFEWADTVSDSFSGDDIEYDDCVTSDSTDYSFGNLTTDICSLLSDSNADKNGYCLVANRIDSGEHIIIDGNYPYSFPKLHSNFWRYGRPYREGVMNGELEQFDGTIRFKKAEFSKKYCCGESIDTGVLRRSPIGNGELEKSSLDLESRIAQLSLIH